MSLPRIAPMPLARFDKPFELPGWIFKLDGFRALAYVEAGACQLISRNWHAFKTFEPLAQAIARELAGRPIILDGEIVHPGRDGRPMFYELMRRRGPFCFYAFDLLWLDGTDLRALPLVERKARLRKLVARRMRTVQYVEHFASGTDLFRIICERDMEGLSRSRQAPSTRRKRRRGSRLRTGSTVSRSDERIFFSARRRDHKSRFAMEDAELRALEAKWRERLENARTRYEEAKAAVQTFRELQSKIHSLDMSFALDDALCAEDHAFAEFKRVPTIFNDLVTTGRFPRRTRVLSRWSERETRNALRHTPRFHSVWRRHRLRQRAYSCLLSYDSSSTILG